MSARRSNPRADASASDDLHVQIIGGRFRGRKLRYHGDEVTRPMKHRVREAIFNLVGNDLAGMHAIDLFAGTGALGLEALSRGADGATFIERHVPTAQVVRENIAALDVGGQAELLITSAFIWSQRNLVAEVSTPEFPAPPRDTPWLVFVSPPYSFFVERTSDMHNLIAALQTHAPPGSAIVVETDTQCDWRQLPGPVRAKRHDAGWDVREYPPAVVGVWRI